MAQQRTVSVGLIANVSNFVAGMAKAEEATRKSAAAMVGSEKSLRAHADAYDKLGKAALGAGGIAAVGLGLVIKASAEFGSKMAQLQTLSHANTAQMKLLSDAAMTAGTAYGYTASQVADAEIEMTKAGVSVSAQLGGALKGALSLAAAGQLDVAQATEITTVAMTQFGLSAKDVPHLADLMSAGADKALGSVGDLGEALKNGGLQAHNMGLSIDDTVGLLSAFANAGIIGAEAGTQMRSMFLRLQNPTSAARKTLSEYGIAINDASGKFVGITKFAGELNDKLTYLKGTHQKLTDAQRNQALATIFGSHAIVSASVLYNDGAKKIGGWISAVNDAGFANAQAAGKLNSLTGDVQKLSAAFQTDLIKAGTGADGSLRSVVQTGTSLLNVIGDIPAPLRDAGVSLTVVVAGVGLLGGAALVAVPKILVFKRAMTDAGISAKSFGGIVGKGGAVILGLEAVGSAFAAMQQHGTASSAQLESAGISIKNGWKDVDKTFAHVHNGIQDVHGLKAALGTLGDGVSEAAMAKVLDGLTAIGGLNPFPTHLADTFKSNEQSLDAMGQQLGALAERSYPQAAASYANLVQHYKLGTQEQKAALLNMPAYRDELVKLAQKAGISASEQNLLNLAQGKGAGAAKLSAAAYAEAQAAATKQAAALQDLSGSAVSAKTDISALQSTIEGFGSAQLDAHAATRAMYQAIDDATAAVRKNGKGLDVTTQAGRDNQAALDGIASAADAAASKTLKQTGSAAKAAAVMLTGRDAFIKAATAMTGSATEAKKLADNLGLIPGNIKVAVTADGFNEAQNSLKNLQQHLAALRDKTISVTVQTQIDVANSQIRVAAMKASGVDYFGNPVHKADGGAILGRGPKGVDSVPAILAPGEHVLTADDVDALGGQSGVYAFRSALEDGEVEAYAKGGAVHRKKKPVHHPAHHPAPKKHAAPNPSGIVAQDNTAKSLTRRIGHQDVTAIHRAEATEKARQRSLDAAQKRYDAIGGGKKDAAAKRRARAALNTAKKREKSAADAVTKAQKSRDDDIAKRDTAKAAASQLRLDREDFQSAERRDPNRRVTDPLAYVDQLRQMSRDQDFTAGRRKTFDAAANKYEAALVKLSAASAKATEKLDNLKQASAQLHDSIAQAVSGGFQASSGLTGAHDASDRTVTSGWITRNGIRMQNTSTVHTDASSGSFTAAGLAGYYTKGGAAAKRFADDLAKLTKRGYPDALVAEVAGYGVETGQPIITALLSASSSQQATISRGYTAIGAQAGRAGTIVADDSYKAQIVAAQKSADQITAQIKTDGEKLRKLIAGAFGLKGYAGGTLSATPGLHWVGEHGPELLRFRGGEQVYTAGASAAYIRGVRSHASAVPVTVQAPQVVMPDTITVQDLHGFTATMQVVAHDVVNRRNHAIAVQLQGVSR